MTARGVRVRVRREAPEDAEAVRDVLVRAFATDGEARLVEALRGRTDPQIAWVAEDGAGAVIGHILYTPVTLCAAGGATRSLGLGLAPMAVTPAHQRTGVGSALVDAGLRACRDAGAALVVVLGHPTYYPRFGFGPAWDHGLYYGAPGPNPAFLVRPLAPGALRDCAGEVRYHPLFQELR